MLIMLTLLQIIAFACPKQALQGVNHRPPPQGPPTGPRQDGEGTPTGHPRALGHTPQARGSQTHPTL